MVEQAGRQLLHDDDTDTNTDWCLHMCKIEKNLYGRCAVRVCDWCVRVPWWRLFLGMNVIVPCIVHIFHRFSFALAHSWVLARSCGEWSLRDHTLQNVYIQFNSARTHTHTRTQNFDLRQCVVCTQKKTKIIMQKYGLTCRCFCRLYFFVKETKKMKWRKKYKIETVYWSVPRIRNHIGWYIPLHCQRWTTKTN